jgi:hypothetical protein
MLHSIHGTLFPTRSRAVGDIANLPSGLASFADQTNRNDAFANAKHNNEQIIK